jgi:hypothetical protein
MGQLNLTQAAKFLKMPKAYLYGVLRAYGMEPVRTGTGKRGKPPQMLTDAQVAEIQRRLEAAAESGSGRTTSAD